ncbi:hypothetical protein M0G43_12915 [Subsaxibacter sp. CAU 1640]|uniref:hypothetical protein n=1 Tax=Subsaxibacter sp. CAU 1640 TaxID=2933271 RepID=UPI00200466B2|nr:hypothetical protein [Subsaxibacter sp. CAU 1640]MCK7591481.1 hypothetical protein [Subsaxibacter sp. CAU 1640]
MKKHINSYLFLWIALLLMCLSCSKSKTPDYASEMKSCLNDTDRKLINDAVQLFEKKLAHKYQRQSIGKAYISYIKELHTQEVEPDFILSAETKTIIDSLKNGGTYDKIWKKLETILKENNRYKDGVKTIDIYTLDPNGIYLNCLIETSKNKIIKKHLMRKRETPEFSYAFAVEDFSSNFTEKDFDDNLNRMIIAINYYYELYSLFEYLKIIKEVKAQ